MNLAVMAWSPKQGLAVSRLVGESAVQTFYLACNLEVGANSDDLNQMAIFDESEMQCKSLRKAGDFEIQDVAGDELLAEVPSSSGQSGTLSHHIQRQAIVNTDMSVFKFPWDKGRLAKIFTDQPIVQMRVPKLQPGRRNLLEMSVQVSEDGSVSARPILKASEAIDSRPAFLDVVRSVEDTPVTADKENKRDQALRAWWTILSHSLVSSAVGRKVAVEARVDNLREVALEILDATFAESRNFAEEAICNSGL